MRVVLAGTLGGLILLVAGCGGGGEGGQGTTSTRACPTAWAAGWQKLADRAGSAVYCPTWMPPPLDGKIDGAYRNTSSVGSDHSYLVSLLFVDREAGGVNGEVHVNFRGYPGSTAIPACADTRTDEGKVTRAEIPCFSDPRGTKVIGGEKVTVYTVNQGIDQWHVLYAWQANGGLYTVSEHVTPPYTFTRVTRNLDRVVRGLVRVEPAST